MKKQFLSKRCEGVTLANDNLALGGIAKRAKAKDSEVKNATIGTLYNEDLKLYTMNTVDEIVKNLEDASFYSYAPVNGGPMYHEAVLNWVFDEQKEKLLSKKHVRVCATPGGTGAVNTSIFLSLDAKETLLLPDFYWGPYKNMAFVNRVEISEYKMFNEDGFFNLDDFKAKAKAIAEKEGKLVTILNDPCNNPTGYSLTNEEFSSLITFLNELEVEATVIYDIAYFDYYEGGANKGREKFGLMSEAASNVQFLICFSASKTFSVYGMRLGALIMLSDYEEVVDNNLDTANCLSRTRWSNTSKAGISMMIAIDKDPTLKKRVKKEIADAANLVKERIAIFNKEAMECGLKVDRVAGGFFICVPCEDGFKAMERLNKLKLYILPFKKAIRVAVCSLPKKEVKGVAKLIKENI